MKPPERIPNELYDRFTMDDYADVEYRYFDESGSDRAWVWSNDKLREMMRKIRNRENAGYRRTTPLFHQALGGYPAVGSRVLVVGSKAPTYECILHAYGATPVTFDYKEIKTEWPETYTDWNKVPVCDAAASISSVEHSGLGRYGEDLNPDGDVEIMRKALRKVKPGGLFYLSVPVGKDKLVWNAHRIYGPRRLAMLTAEWEWVDSFGLTRQAGGYKEAQPVIVLRRPE